MIGEKWPPHLRTTVNRGAHGGSRRRHWPWYCSAAPGRGGGGRGAGSSFAVRNGGSSSSMEARWRVQVNRFVSVDQPRPERARRPAEPRPRLGRGVSRRPGRTARLSRGSDFLRSVRQVTGRYSYIFRFWAEVSTVATKRSRYVRQTAPTSPPIQPSASKGDRACALLTTRPPPTRRSPGC